MCRKYIIPVGDISEEEAKKLAKKLIDEFNSGKVIPELQEILPSTNTTNMDRIDIFNRITGERLYQDMMYANREDGVPDNQKPVSEWLNYIEYHLQKAKNHNYKIEKEESIHELRKIAALAVAAMEVHGCPAREIKRCDCSENCKDSI